MAKLVDLTLPWSVETPSWPYFPNPKVEAFHRHAREGLNSLIVETAMHTGTHVDAPLHVYSGGWDLAEIPLDRLYGEALIVDVSHKVEDWTQITVDMLRENAVDHLRQDDIVIFHTGWHRYAWCSEEEDEEKYFCRHPGPSNELVDFLVDRHVRFVGTDCPAFEHPFNTAIRDMRVDLVEEFQAKVGKSLEEVLPRRHMLYSHKKFSRNNLCLVECLGAGLKEVVGRRVKVGAFPWRFVRGEGSIARVVAFLEP